MHLPLWGAAFSCVEVPATLSSSPACTLGTPQAWCPFSWFSHRVQPSAAAPGLKGSVLVGKRRGRWSQGKGLEGSVLVHVLFILSPL